MLSYVLKAIPHTRFGNTERRRLLIGFDLLTQVTHVDAQRLHVGALIVGPR